MNTEQGEQMMTSHNTKPKGSGGEPSIFADDKGNLKIVNLVVRYPCLIFIIVLATCVAITILLVTTVFSNGYPFTDDKNTFDLYDERSIAYDSFRLAKEKVLELASENEFHQSSNVDIQKNSSSVDKSRVQEKVGDVIYWIYESKTNEGLFGNKDSIEIMRKAETMFTSHEDYQDYCWLKYVTIGNETTTSCRKPLSALNVYYASSWNSTKARHIISELTSEKIELYNKLAVCVEYNMFCKYIPSSMIPYIAWANEINEEIESMISHWDGLGEINKNITEVTTFLAYLNKVITKSPRINFFFDSNFTIDHPVTMYSRSIIYWGAPLKGFDYGNGEESSSRGGKSQGSDDSQDEVRKRHIVKNHLNDMKKIASKDHNSYLNSYYFMGALIFEIIIEILVQDATKAMISFILVFVYLRMMVGSWLLASVGMLEIFMSIPIAWFFFSVVLQIKYFSTLNVICIFIVAAIGADDIFVFMDAYKQSAHKGKDVLESLEARMSWVYRRSGNAMAITSATTCAAFLCTIASPIASTRSFGIFAALVILFDYILVMTLFCTAVVIYHNRFEQPGTCFFTGCCALTEPNPTRVALERVRTFDNGGATIINESEDKTSQFFRTKVSNFILNPKASVIIAIPMTIWIIIASLFATNMEPTKTTEQSLRSDHPLQKGANILDEKFPRTQLDAGTTIHFTWGIDEVNRENVNQLFYPDYTGLASFNDFFSLSEQCQTQMLNMCDRLKTEDRFESLIKRQSDGLREVKCFVEELGAYNVLGSLKDCDMIKSGAWKNLTWQVADLNNNQEKFNMKEFLSNKSCYGEGLISDVYKESIGWDGKSLRYAGFSFESSTLSPFGILAESKVREQYDKLIDVSKEFDSQMSIVCGSNAIMTDLDQKFVFMNNQRIYRTSAVSGSMLGVFIAFIVLLISTKTFYVALSATLSILCVLISVIGLISMMGWTLGTNEAILISILAGFSVDYVVHLAHAFVHTEGGVEERVRGAFGDMGISVFSGMLTSVVASIPLFLCNLTFFAKFGTFLCLTITFSWLFANLGFMSILARISCINRIK